MVRATLFEETRRKRGYDKERENEERQKTEKGLGKEKTRAGNKRRHRRRVKGRSTRNRGEETQERLWLSTSLSLTCAHAQPCQDSPWFCLIVSTGESSLCDWPVLYWHLMTLFPRFHTIRRRETGHCFNTMQTSAMSIQPSYYFCFSPIHAKSTQLTLPPFLCWLLGIHSYQSVHLRKRSLFASSKPTQGEGLFSYHTQTDATEEIDGNWWFVNDIIVRHAPFACNNTWEVVSYTRKTGLCVGGCVWVVVYVLNWRIRTDRCLFGGTFLPLAGKSLKKKLVLFTMWMYVNHTHTHLNG